MQLTSKDGNMVVDYYPVKTWAYNTIDPNFMLKVLSFRGDTQKKMIIKKSEYDFQCKEYVDQYRYKVTDNNAHLPQFFSSYLKFMEVAK